MRLLKALFSLLTGIGGHFINRRWDRAVFFMGLLFAWTLIGFIAFNLVADKITSQDIEGYRASVPPLIFGLASGYLVILILSGLFTWRDGRRDAAARSNARSVMAGVGAGLTTITTFVLLVYVVFVGSIYYQIMGSPAFQSVGDESASATGAGKPNDQDESVVTFNSIASNNWFWGGLYFGGNPPYSATLKPLPEGDAYLIGVVRHQEAPVVGARLKLKFNGQYESANVVTDSEGRFTLRVPAGEWMLNALEMDRWPERPAGGEYMLVNAGEGAASDGYEGGSRRFPNGLPLASTADRTPNLLLVVDIREYVRLTWPDKNESKAPATMVNSALRWDPYPEAARYRVRISEVIRTDSGATYYPVATRSVEGVTKLPLSEVPSIAGDTESREYSVEVSAYAEDGRFLSETGHAFEGGTFTLTDGHQLLKESAAGYLGEGASPEEVRQMLDNDRRVDAVEVLIRDDMLDAAETLLGKIDVASAGRIDAVTGFLRANQGRCEEAKALLEEAKTSGGNGCVPEDYWGACR